MTTYYSLDHDGKPRTMLAIISTGNSLTYRRWDLDSKGWIDDSRLVGYLTGFGGGGGNVNELSADKASTLAQELGIKLPA